MIDTHLHLWDLSRGGNGWLAPRHGELYRSFGVTEADRELAAAGVDGVVLVQAEDSVAETDFLLAAARGWPRARGVVGWVDLAEPEAARAQLAARAGDPLFLGVRHLIHDDPREDFLALPGVRESLRELARRGLTLDIPDAWPRHLGATVALARALPELSIVLDHLGKPPAGAAPGAGHAAGSEAAAERARWERTLRELAALPNTVAKLSGLPLDPHAISAGLDIALECFGPHRIMYGGDWPMTVPAGGYGRAWPLYRDALDALDPADRHAILVTTPERVYGMTPIAKDQPHASGN